MRKKTALFLYSAIILFLSVIPVSVPEAIESLPIDKLVHFFLYMGLALLLAEVISGGRSALFVFVYGAGWGIFMEIIQFFLPYRSFEIQDIVTNSIGVITGICISYVIGDGNGE